MMPTREDGVELLPKTHLFVDVGNAGKDDRLHRQQGDEFERRFGCVKLEGRAGQPRFFEVKFGLVRIILPLGQFAGMITVGHADGMVIDLDHLLSDPIFVRAAAQSRSFTPCTHFGRLFYTQ
jgi:hypothetical protein